MPEGPNSQESLGGKIAETAAKVIPQPKGPSERGLVNMLDKMSDGNADTPRKSLEALAEAKLDTPVSPPASPEAPQAPIKKKADNAVLPKTTEYQKNTNSSPENKP